LGSVARGAIALALVLGLGGTAQAHDPFQITTDARLRADALEVRVTMLGNTAAHLCGAVDGGRIELDAATFAALRGAFERCAPGLYEIRAGGAPLPPTLSEIALGVEGDVDFRIVYPRPAKAPLRFDAVHLARLTDPTYGAELTVTGEGTFLGQALLRADARTLEVPLTGAAPDGTRPLQPPQPSGTAYLRLGVWHILGGFDHLLFLAGLLIVCRRLRSILTIVTCFTVAHSLTLALAALNVVTLPSRVVEPLIAATIVFVGAENLLRSGDSDKEPRGRAVLTLAFGLIHGFGFASALREIGLGAGGAPLLLPLFSFNLGVELGQVAVAAVFLPLVWRLRRWPPFARYGVRAVSLVIVATGTYWLLARTIL
jgi:hydrogenase/urease accessory protein HupE